MSSIIKFSVAELRRLATSNSSCVEERRVTQSVALQPWCLANLKESVKNLLDYKIGKFDKEYDGILLSYKNLHIVQNVGAIRNDHTDINFQVQADFFIFRPYIGAVLTGVINKKSVTHLGILVHRVFNVVIPRPTEQPGNRWIGMRTREGSEVTFKVVMLDLFGALPYIRGELDERCLEDMSDIEEDAVETQGHVTVSHVNFDNTKPLSARPREDKGDDNKVRSAMEKTSVKKSARQLKAVKSKYLTPTNKVKISTSEDEKVNSKSKRSKQTLLKPQSQEPSNATLRQIKKQKYKES